MAKEKIMLSKAMVAVLLALTAVSQIQADEKDTHHRSTEVAAARGHSHERAPMKAHEQESKPAITVSYAALAAAPAVSSESRAPDGNEQFTKMVCCP